MKLFVLVGLMTFSIRALSQEVGTGPRQHPGTMKTISNNKSSKNTGNLKKNIPSFDGQTLWGWCNTDIKIRGISPKTDHTEYGTLLGKRYKLKTVQCNSDGDHDGFTIEYNDDGVAVEYWYYDAAELDYRYHLKVHWQTRKPLEYTNKNKSGATIGIEETHDDFTCYAALTRYYYNITGHCDSVNSFDCKGQNIRHENNPYGQ